MRINYVPERIVHQVCNSKRVSDYMAALKHGTNPIDLADLRELVRIALHEGADVRDRCGIGEDSTFFGQACI